MSSHFQNLFLFIFLLPSFAFSDIKGFGNLRFDANNDTQVDAILNSTGLSLGPNVPSANLDVSGNAKISHTLSIGGASSQANLNFQGTLRQSSFTINSHQSLPNASLILANTSSDNIRLELPDTAGIEEQRYLIKKTSPNHDLILWGGSIDQASELVFSSQNESLLPYIELYSSSANQWYVTAIEGESQSVSTSNLIVWFPLDESSGNISYDKSSNDLNAVITNIASDNIGIPSQVEQSLYFDGVDDQVILSDSAELDSITSELTVCFWVKDENQGSNSGYISKEINASQGWAIEDDRFFIWCSGDNADNAYDDIDDNEWHHMAYTWDGTDSKVYKDGVLFDSLTDGAGTISTNDDPLILGYTKLSANNENEFEGQLDEVRVYNVALSADQIALIYDTYK